MKKLVYLFSLLAVPAVMTSCSSDDEGGGESGPSSIELTADATAIELGDTVTFTVMDDNGNDVTAESAFTAGSTVLPSNTFTPESSGEHTVYATYDGLTSNEVTVNVTATAQTNNIFFEEQNYGVSNAALVYWGAVNLEDPESETPTHAYFSLYSADVADVDGLIALISGEASKNNYIEIDFATELVEQEGELYIDYPSAANDGTYLELYGLTTGGTDILTEGGSDETGASLDFTSDIVVDEELATTLSYEYATVTDGTPVSVSFDSGFLGVLDGTGERVVELPKTKVISAEELTAAKQAFVKNLK